MSYPPIRYTGEHGEITGRFRPASHPPEVTTRGGGTFRYLSTGADTGGDFGLYEVELPPGGGTATHFHRTIAEAFYVLRGTLRLFDGQELVDATAGDHLYIPAGGLHAFHNVSDAPTAMLMLFTPGAPREGYFEGLDGLANLDEAQRAEFFREHDNHFVEGGGPSTGASR